MKIKIGRAPFDRSAATPRFPDTGGWERRARLRVRPKSKGTHDGLLAHPSNRRSYSIDGVRCGLCALPRISLPHAWSSGDAASRVLAAAIRVERFSVCADRRGEE